jgi:hypothetical protein
MDRSDIVAIVVGSCGLTTTLVGMVVGLVVHYTGSDFPAETAGILVGGFLFFPVYFVHTSRRGYVSTREAWRLRTEVRRKTANQ